MITVCKQCGGLKSDAGEPCAGSLCNCLPTEVASEAKPGTGVRISAGLGVSASERPPGADSCAIGREISDSAAIKSADAWGAFALFELKRASDANHAGNHWTATCHRTNAEIAARYECEIRSLLTLASAAASERLTPNDRDQRQPLETNFESPETIQKPDA